MALYRTKNSLDTRFTKPSSRLSFQCWLRSRTPSQWASPESWAPPVQVVVLLLLSQARLWFLQLQQWPQHLQQRPRPVMRWRPLCCAPRLLGPPLPGRALVLVLLRRCPNVLHGHRVAVPALLLVCVALSPSRSRDWSRAWPPRVAHLSRLPSCASHALLALSTLPRQSRQPSADASGPPPLPPLRPPRPLVPRSPASDSDDEWDALLDAHGLAGTAAAVAQPADAAGASRRARDKRRRRQRKAAKRSMWRDI